MNTGGCRPGARCGSGAGVPEDVARGRGKDHPVQFPALLIDEPEHHGGPLAGPGRGHVEGDEAVVVVPGLGPVHGLVGHAEITLIDVRPGLPPGVPEYRRAAALAYREVAVPLMRTRPAVARRARGG